MDFPIHIDTISMDLSILYFKGHRSKFLKIEHISVPEDCFYLMANSADPDEMPHYAAFYLGLYLFTGTQNEKGYR